MTFSGILLKSFSENLKQLTKMTKMNHFSNLFAFFMKTVGFCSFHCRYEFCMQKYLNNGIFIKYADNAKFPPILSKALPCCSADFLKNLKNSNFALFVFLSI